MSQVEKQREIARARERADLARLRFSNAVSGVLDRLTPEQLRAEAYEVAAEQFGHAKRELLERLRHWPVALAAASLGFAALMFWRPARVAARYGLRALSLVWATRDLWRR